MAAGESHVEQLHASTARRRHVALFDGAVLSGSRPSLLGEGEEEKRDDSIRCKNMGWVYSSTATECVEGEDVVVSASLDVLRLDSRLLLSLLMLDRVSCRRVCLQNSSCIGEQFLGHCPRGGANDTRCERIWAKVVGGGERGLHRVRMTSVRFKTDFPDSRRGKISPAEVEALAVKKLIPNP